MVEEDKSLESEVENKEEAPKRPGRPKKVAVKPKEEPKVETKDEDPKASEDEESPEKSDAPRVIKKGEAIDVAVDENSVAQETVYQEYPLLGTSKVSRVLVASKGSHYRKG